LQAAALAKLTENNVPVTDDSFKYHLDGISAKVLAIWQGSPEHGSWVDSVPQGSTCGVILDKTNFYAESGGQIFDSGFVEGAQEEFKFHVKDVQVYGGYVAHIGEVSSGELKVSQEVSCSVNIERRIPIMSNHTCAHLVNLAIRKIISSQSDQRGSVVSEDRFRFDFSSPEGSTRDQLCEVETFVNDLINSAIPVHISEVPLNEARDVEGVRAIFTEHYPNPVRVVSIGAEIDEIFS